MKQASNALLDADHKGPVFKAKQLKIGDVIEWHTHTTYTYRILGNSSDEVLLQRYSSYNTDSKRVKHAKLDEANFVHIGKIPGFFKRMFMDIDKF